MSDYTEGGITIGSERRRRQRLTLRIGFHIGRSLFERPRRDYASSLIRLIVMQFRLGQCWGGTDLLKVGGVKLIRPCMIGC